MSKAGQLLSRAAVLMAGLLVLAPSAPAQGASQDPVRCTPYRLDWDNGLNGSLDVGALSALRTRIGGQGLTEVCRRLLGEIDRQLARAQEAGRALPPPAAPVASVLADEIAWGNAQRVNSCEAYRSFLTLFQDSRFVAPAEEARDRLCALPAVTGPAAALRAAQGGEPIANRRFTECAECPEMVAVPGGTFVLGSPPIEQGRLGDEGPRESVTLQPFAVSRFEVTRAQYGSFLRETGRMIGGDCWVLNKAGSGVEQQQGGSWQAPGFEQTDQHPVVCVSWEDTQAYVAWINSKVNGDPYRLLTESEWEYAARAGTITRYWWGDAESDLCAHANGADQSIRSLFPHWGPVASCSDGQTFTAPVGFSGRENNFGLADMAGNVSEWSQDCYNKNYELTQTNGAVSTSASCPQRVIRGGSWLHMPDFLRSAFRSGDTPSIRYLHLGFRLARGL